MGWFSDNLDKPGVINANYEKVRKAAIKEAQKEINDPKTKPSRAADLRGLVKRYGR